MNNNARIKVKKWEVNEYEEGKQKERYKNK